MNRYSPSLFQLSYGRRLARREIRQYQRENASSEEPSSSASFAKSTSGPYALDTRLTSAATVLQRHKSS